MIRQEEKTPREIGSEKTTMQRDEVPIAKVWRSEVGFSSTTERSKEWSGEPNGEEEKKVLQDLVQNLERTLNKQNKYITTLRREHNGQILKWRWTPRSGDAWDDQTIDVKNENTDISFGQDDL